MPLVRPFEGKAPVLGEGVWLAEGAMVIGDVVLGAESSVWFHAVVRGDVHFVRIGARVNVQDLTVVHVTGDRHPCVIEDDVIIGHRAVVHGCTVRRRALIGIGSVILDGAEIGEDAMVAGGAVVSPGTRIPPGMVAMGVPARPVRPVTDAEKAFNAWSVGHYVELARRYQAG
jgi:carbonic anhydrase/acetyltransferase-like protein (isoleucine patch superfamily)